MSTPALPAPATYAAVRTPSCVRASDVLDIIRGCRFLWASEVELQRGIAAALEHAGLPVEREVRLNARDRIDLLVGRVGIEVKTAGAWRDVGRQCDRYLDSDMLDELVLVTAKAQHRRVMRGRDMIVHQLEASGL